MPTGSLTVVGTGILYLEHLTAQATKQIERADTVLYALADPATAKWVRDRNPSAEPFSFYLEGRPRRDTYSKWVEEMLDPVRTGRRVCAVFYGHPGIGVDATHEALRLAREEGYKAVMMPGISATDCLFAELGVNPVLHGCSFFDATDFLVRRRRIDTSISLVLWQIEMIGEKVYGGRKVARQGLAALGDVLQDHYGANHDVIVYEASPFVIVPPRIEHISLSNLAGVDVTGASTLYVPPSHTAEYDPEMLERLQIDVP